MNQDQIYELITINTASIKSMQSKVSDLKRFAKTILNSDSKVMEVSIEEQPTNGNQIIVTPIYDPRTQGGSQGIISYYSEDDELGGNVPLGAPKPKQVGYAKVFKNLDNIPNIQSIAVGVDVTVALGVIDKIIASLNNKIATLQAENAKYIKK